MKASQILAQSTALLLLTLSSSIGLASVRTEAIEYKQNDQTFEGALVTPEKINKDLPMIVLVHNWMGVTDETKNQAARFAELGYQVFTADIYGKDKRPKNVKEAGELATQYKKDRQLFRSRLNLALQTALQQKHVNKSKVAVVGYCFGGTGAIELARSGAPVMAAISFHGGLDSPVPADGKNIKGQVLALHGEDDPFVPAQDVTAFENEMKTNHIKYQLIKYPHAVHSFTEKAAGQDNSKGAAYNENADKKSFEEAKKLLKSIF